MAELQQLFGRVCKVTAWKQPTSSSFFEQLGNGVEITDLRMQFNIDKHLAKEPNTCTITISNLEHHSRMFLCQKPLHVRIDAGYLDSGARNLFMGDLTIGFSKRVGPDIETKLQIGDGARAYAHARCNKSFKPPVSVREVLKYAASTMDLELPLDLDSEPDFAQAMSSGISMHGPTRDILTRLLAPYGYHWCFQNGRLQILRDDQILDTAAFLINAGAGLIGSPERSAPDKKTGRSELTFETLLYPELIPGATVKLESEEIQGTFKMIQVTHTGDTRGVDFKTAVKAVPL